MGPLCRYIGRKISSIIHSLLLSQSAFGFIDTCQRICPLCHHYYTIHHKLERLVISEHNLRHHSLFFRSDSLLHLHKSNIDVYQSIITSPVMKCTYYENTGSLYTTLATPCYCQIVNYNYCFIIHMRDRMFQLLVICKALLLFDCDKSKSLKQSPLFDIYLTSDGSKGRKTLSKSRRRSSSLSSNIFQLI